MRYRRSVRVGRRSRIAPLPVAVALAAAQWLAPTRAGWAWTAWPGPGAGSPPSSVSGGPPAANAAGSAPPALGALPPLPPAAGPAPGTLAPPRLVGPLVYLRADNPRTTLQIRIDEDQWQDLCRVPCGAPLDPSQVYRVNGRSFVPTESFQLPRSSGQVSLEARMGLKVRNITGRILTPIGGALILAGALLFLAGSQSSELSDQDVVDNRDRRALHLYGVVAAVGGLGIGLAGLILWRGNVSRVEVE